MTVLLTPSPCNLCWNGAPITLPNKEIVIPGFEFVNNCQALADFAPVLFQQDSDECALLQSIGTICGCPKQEGACDLCSDGSLVEYGWRELAFLADSFGGIVPTCELAEAGLHSYSKTDSYCKGSQQFLGKYCGCGAKPDSEPITTDNKFELCNLCYDAQPVPFPNKTIDIVGFPFQTCGQLDQATKILFENNCFDSPEGLIGNNCFLMRQLSTHCGCNSYHEEPCPICKVDNTYEVPFPEKRLDITFTRFFMGDLELSCGILADVAMTWSATDLDHKAVCGGLQGLGTQCGCAMPEAPACEVCPNALPKESYGLTISDTAPYDLISCGLFSVATLFLENGDQLPVGLGGEWIDYECRLFKYSGFLCGCNDGLFTYWGAETVEMLKAAVWMQRATAILSLVGSIAILIDITTKRRTKRGMYYEIMTCLSISDILSSIAWGLGPLPTNLDLSLTFGVDPSLFKEGVGPEIYGSHGNEVSCKVQGFLLHWGFTSILYNVALSYFYKLSVVDGWRDSHFTRWHRVLIIVIPAVIGTGVALAAIPFITFTPLACSIGSSKDLGGWAKLIGLFYLPYGPAFIYTPLNTFYIFWKVREQSRRGGRWRMSSLARQQSFVTRWTGAITDEIGDPDEPQTRTHGMVRGRSSIFVSQTETHMESLVFWQSCWYVAAFFFSYSIFLVAFALDGWVVESYWFYILLSILTPMQGFFNGCVYFRNRISKWVRGDKRRQIRPKYTAKALCDGITKSFTAIFRWGLRSRPLSSSINTPNVRNEIVLKSSYFPDDISANLSQPLEVLNDRRTNVIHSEEENERKIEELLLQETSLSLARLSSSIDDAKEEAQDISSLSDDQIGQEQNIDGESL